MSFDSEPLSLAEELVRQRPFLRRIAEQLVGRDSADDVVQDAYLATLERRGPVLRPRAFLATVVRNLSRSRAKSEVRRRDREHASARPERDGRAELVPERLELVRRVAEAVAGLPEPFRDAVYRATYEDESPARIAVALGIPLETARSRLRRGKALLAESLDREYGGDRRAWATLLVPFLSPSALAPLPVRGPELGAPRTLWVPLMTSKLAVTAASLIAVSALCFLAWPTSDRDPAGTAPESVARAPEAELSASGPLEIVAPGARPGSREAAPGAPVEDGEPGPPATTAALALRVRYASDGAAAAGLAGRVRGADGLVRTFGTDAAGAARLDDLVPGGVWVTLNGHGAWRAELVAGAEEELECEIPAGITIDGLVLGPDGQPVGGAEIFDADDDPLPGEATIATTDAAGRFRARDLAAWRSGGPWTELAAQRAGFTTSRGFQVRGAAGDELKLVLRLDERAGSLRGRVADADGNARPDVDVELRPYNSRSSSTTSAEGFELSGYPALVLRSDADGRFVSDSVPPGIHTVRLIADGHPERRVPCEISAGETTELAVRLATGGVVEGRLTGSDGPIAGASVSAHGSGDRRLRWSVSATDGSFRFVGLPAGACELSASTPDGSATGEVEVAEGEVARVELVVGARETRIGGRLLDARGEALAHYKVNLIRRGEPGLWHRTSVTAEDGSFALEQGDDFEGALEVRSPSVFATPPLLTVDVDPEQATGLVLVVPDEAMPSASLRGSVSGEATGHVEGLHLTLRRTDGERWSRQASADRVTGGFELGRLVPGAYELLLRAPGYLERVVEVSLAVDESADLGELVLRRGGIVHVELEGMASQAPVLLLEPRGGGASERLQVSGSSASSPVVGEGAYTLFVSGLDVAAVKRDVDVTAGSTTALRLELEPGTLRSFALSPRPDDPATLQVRVFDASGARFEGYHQIWGDQLDVFGLTLGSWRVEVTDAAQRRARASFEVEELDLVRDRIALDLE